MQNGRCSTPKISECHRTEKGVSLSGILEAEAPQKYFLSKEQIENSVSIIGHRDGYRRNTQVFSQEGITEALDTAAGGGRGPHIALPCFIDLCNEGSKFTIIRHDA